MKYSVSSYSFSQLLKSGSITQLSMIKLAKDIGFDGIEFTDILPEEGYTEEEYAIALRNEAKKTGINIIAYTISANLVAEDIQEQIDLLKHKIDIASLLGAPILRHDLFFSYPEGKPQEFDLYVEGVANAVRTVTEYAKTKNIKTCTENHGFICQDAERVEKMIKAVDNENFGWLIDIGNFICTCGDCIESVRLAAKYAFHVHAKDFIKLPPDGAGFKITDGSIVRGTVIGKGCIPVKECVQILKEAGYDGYLTVEFEGPEECVSAIKEGLEYLRTC